MSKKGEIMNSFIDASEIGDWGEQQVADYLTRKYGSVKIVPKAIEVQMEWADLVVPASLNNGVNLRVEVKAEERFTGNLFWETWSNYPVRQGWGRTTPADELYYLFRNNNSAYRISDLPTFKWLIDYFEPTLKEISQSKYDQHNDTRGLLVPIDDFCLIQKLR